MLTLLGAGQGQVKKSGEEAFIISVKTDNAGTSATNQFTIPTSTSGITQAFNYDIETSDGQTITGVTGNTTITFPTAGEYDVSITGDFPRIYFNNGGDKDKALEIKNWGDNEWTSLEGAFEGCSNLDFDNSIDPPNLTNCTSISRCFRLCLVLGNMNGGNIDLSSWDVSNILNFNGFYLAYNYNNLNISGWVINENANIVMNIPRVQNLDVTNIDLGTRTSISSMFFQDAGRNYIGLNTWDISNITNFSGFMGRSSEAITSESWDSMIGWSFQDGCNFDLFFYASSNFTNLANSINIKPSSAVACFGFSNNPETLNNLDLNHWDMSLCTDVRQMFRNTQQFQQDIFSQWDITNISNFTNFMGNSEGLTSVNYNTTLIAWEQTLQNAYPNGVGYPHNISIDFGNSQYTYEAIQARDSLINTFGWTIVDGGEIFVGLLDEYPNAAAAYSLRELSTAFVGQPVVRVRRSSDNTEQDFTSAEITDGTLTTFTGANDGFVTIWYDQSGGGNNAAQTTATRQPKIVSSGVVELENNKPCLKFSDITSNALSLNNISTFSVYAVAKSKIGEPSGYGIENLLTNLRARNGLWGNGTDYVDFWQGGGTLKVNNENALVTGGVDSTVQNIISTSRPTGATFGVSVISNASFGVRQWRGTIQEMILYTETNNPDAYEIVNNINTEYTIY